MRLRSAADPSLLVARCLPVWCWSAGMQNRLRWPGAVLRGPAVTGATDEPEDGALHDLRFVDCLRNCSLPDAAATRGS
ncbi:hypothetical protein NDU88_006323 [Pleurodeles waltl]|uniref:Secreted protein n=1 Tax=Pleurodeles waltl TaxID=8319 RepID=A0AAV7TWY3_PLEWA|nr:hypothetical protein NDU88_006323 [Pleurodeles waltl]